MMHGHDIPSLDTPTGRSPDDDRIREEIHARLFQADALNPDEMSVSVTGGRVVLDGYVRKYWQIILAETLTQAVPGVRDVENRLQIVPERIRQGLSPGMPVVNERYEEIGVITRVFGESFVMNCHSHGPAYVPFYIIQGVSDRWVFVDRAVCSPEVET